MEKKEKEVEQWQVISFLMRCRKNAMENVPDEKELIEAHERVLEDLRTFDY